MQLAWLWCHCHCLLHTLGLPLLVAGLLQKQPTVQQTCLTNHTICAFTVTHKHNTNIEGVNQALLSTTVKRSGVFVIPAAALRDAALEAELHATTQHACAMHKCSKNLCFYQKDATRD